MNVLIISLIVLLAIYTIALFAAITWSGIRYQDAGLSPRQGAITAVVGMLSIALQIFITVHHINLI